MTAATPPRSRSFWRPSRTEDPYRSAPFPPSLNLVSPGPRLPKSPSDSRGPPFLQPLQRGGDQARQDRHEYDDHDHDLDVVLHPGKLAQVIPDQGHRDDPQQSAEDVEGQEAAVLHLPHAGHDRRERADDRHEAGDDDRLAAVLLVEIVSAPQMRGIEETGAGTVEQSRTGLSPDPVADRVAEDGGGHQENVQPPDAQVTVRGEHSGGDE